MQEYKQYLSAAAFALLYEVRRGKGCARLLGAEGQARPWALHHHRAPCWPLQRLWRRVLDLLMRTAAREPGAIFHLSGVSDLPQQRSACNKSSALIGLWYRFSFPVVPVVPVVPSVLSAHPVLFAFFPAFLHRPPPPPHRAWPLQSSARLVDEAAHCLMEFFSQLQPEVCPKWKIEVSFAGVGLRGGRVGKWASVERRGRRGRLPSFSGRHEQHAAGALDATTADPDSDCRLSPSLSHAAQGSYKGSRGPTERRCLLARDFPGSASSAQQYRCLTLLLLLRLKRRVARWLLRDKDLQLHPAEPKPEAEFGRTVGASGVRRPGNVCVAWCFSPSSHTHLEEYLSARIKESALGVQLTNMTADNLLRVWNRATVCALSLAALELNESTISHPHQV